MKSKIFFLLILTVFLVGCAAEQARDAVSAKETEIEEVLEETEIAQPQTIEDVAEITITMVYGEFQLIVIRGIEHSIGVSNIFRDAASISIDGEEIEVNIGGKETVNGLQISVIDILLSSKETVSDKVEFIVKAVD